MIGHPKLTAGIVTSDVNPVGAASRGLSRATAHVSTAMAVRSEMNGLEIARESPSRGRCTYGQNAQLLSEATSTSYWLAYYWLHLHMR